MFNVYISRCSSTMGFIIQNNHANNLREVNRKKRFSLALLASIMVHALFFFMLSVNTTEPSITKKKSPPIMDVVLLDESQTSQQDSNDDAKTIANKNSSDQQQMRKTIAQGLLAHPI